MQRSCYGENSHQKTAFYQYEYPQGLIQTEQLQGKELSFNNILDTNAAYSICKQFNDKPAAVVIKHTNPCGVAVADTILDAYKKTYKADSLSVFGA